MTPIRPVLLTIDAHAGTIYCTPTQSPADMMEHALNIVVSAIVEAAVRSGSTNPTAKAHHIATQFALAVEEAVRNTI